MELPCDDKVEQRLVSGVEVRGAVTGRFHEILSPEALQFVAELHRVFNPQREALLHRRAERQARLEAGERPSFLPETSQIRAATWQIAPVPADLQDRRVEITGPADRKMMINALNSGARVFMADFEDANSPTWTNCIEGQINLRDAVRRCLDYTSPDGRSYQLCEHPATLMVRPRGWHLVEKHLWVDGQPVAASLFDAGLYLFHNARQLLAQNSGPYLYLPKLESHQEARLWNNLFCHAQDELGIGRGSIKATVLIETILAAFEMEEILWELREHAAGLNAGRWDYIFSMIKKFCSWPEMLLPDRSQVTMTVPFMRAYTELLVRTCHRRGAHAIGGMAAFIPNRRDPQVTALAIASVRNDKRREAADGFDGTWVAHPDLVPVAREMFDHVLGDQPHQVARQREDVTVAAKDLLDLQISGSTITEAGLRNNISVALQYLESWLRGVGAVAIFNLMEDTATAEISRSQIWQWVQHGAMLHGDGRPITADLVSALARDELEQIRRAVGDETYLRGRYDEALALFEQVALGEPFVDFLTLPAYAHLE